MVDVTLSFGLSSILEHSFDAQETLNHGSTQKYIVRHKIAQFDAINSLPSTHQLPMVLSKTSPIGDLFSSHSQFVINIFILLLNSSSHIPKSFFYIHIVWGSCPLATKWWPYHSEYVSPIANVSSKVLTVVVGTLCGRDATDRCMEQWKHIDTSFIPLARVKISLWCDSLQR